MKRVRVAVAVILLGMLAGTSYFALEQHQRSKFLEALVPHVKNASIRAAYVIEFDTSDDFSNITVAEFRAKQEESISQIDKELFAIETLSTSSTSPTVKLAAAYVKACQALLRARLRRDRLGSAFSVASVQFDKVKSMLGVVDSHAPEAKAIIAEADKKVDEALVEYDGATKDLRESTTKLETARAAIGAELPDDALVAVDQLTLMAKKFKKSP